MPHDNKQLYAYNVHSTIQVIRKVQRWRGPRPGIANRVLKDKNNVEGPMHPTSILTIKGNSN